jgi:hypothetical protein
MAVGFMISVDRGNNKVDMVIAASTAGTAGLEINVDPAKYPEPGRLAKDLIRASELVLEGGIINAYPPA